VSDSSQDAQAPNNQPQPQPLGFVASVVLILVCLFGARATVSALGFTGYRIFEDGAVWWQVLVYFGIAVGYYALGAWLVGVMRARAFAHRTSGRPNGS
jgi:hypothetical protein